MRQIVPVPGAGGLPPASCCYQFDGVMGFDRGK
jgi:hypothetical protein